jgi:hypothetical protein
MKCVTNGKVVRRLPNEEAAKLVKAGWQYCPKHRWKSVRQPKT